MLVKKICFKNFRQFKDKQEIEFASGDNNITIIMGENGSGKTTLAQAFSWVLYGETEFKDKKILNKKSIDDALIGDSIFVRVDLYIEVDDVEITITRSQEYIKKANKIEENQAELQISFKKEGQIKYIDKADCQHYIENILPKELSSFFIFSGERIKNMSDEIQNGKSKEFANAVRNLVGLNAIMNTLSHLKGKTTVNNNTVIGRYNKKIDETSDEKVKKINREIDKYEKYINDLNNMIEKIKPNIGYYQRESIKLDQEIMNYAPAEKIRKEYDFISKQIKEYEHDYAKAIKNYFNFFNNNAIGFFIKPAVQTSQDEIKHVEVVNEGIPHIHADTIKYILKKGKCICGNEVNIGSEESIHLTKLLDYLPPKSIGTLLAQNKKNGERFINKSATFFDAIDNYYKRIRQLNKDINKGIATQTNMRERIVDTSNLYELKNKKADFEKKARVSQEDLDNKIRSVGSYQESLNRERAEKAKYINIDNKNKKYIEYRDYALELYDRLYKDYNVAELQVRELLQNKINRIFTSILESGLYLELDDNYNVKVRVEELENQHDDIERSTAQNYSVIFAFIAGIIEIAKEKSKDDTKGIFDKAVGYPLIMDAPLSAFDKRRISNICDTIPKIAQQVIFFIKDTDGDVAKEHLGNSLGKKYNIVKESLIVSNIK